jgi:hypothetical protein
LLLVNGRPVVRDGVVQTVDEGALAGRIAAAHRKLVTA